MPRCSIRSDFCFKYKLHILTFCFPQQLSPLVDYFQEAVTKLNPDGTPATPDSKYQYQRALALSVSLKDNLYVYSSEQLKELQAQHVLMYVLHFFLKNLGQEFP